MEAVNHLVAIVLSIIIFASVSALFRPLPWLGLPTRKRAQIVIIVSFMAAGIFVNLSSKPPVQEERVQKKQEEWPWWRTVLPKEYQNDPAALQSVMACQTDEQCWGNWNKRWAIPACVDFINSFDNRGQWATTRPHEDAFTRWHKDNLFDHMIAYWSDQFMVRDRYGYLKPMIYKCVFNPEKGEVFDAVNVD